MNDEHVRGGEVILANGEQATLQDTTQGTIHLYVGPTQKNLDKTDRPVRWDVDEERFIPCGLTDSITQFAKADEGQYLVLLNPTKGDGQKTPQKGQNQATPELEMGRKVNIPGPVQIPLWPGQSAHAIDGHTLRTDQYVLCCVYNQEAAGANWDEAVVDGGTSEEGEGGDNKTSSKKEDSGLQRPKSLAIGKTFHVTGSEAAYYMPPTGIEVVPTADEDGEECYVRDAVTLERLQYCALLNESGDKRYVIGPEVVFPEPTEAFVRQDSGAIVAQALELNHLMALYIKVTADYEDEEIQSDGSKRKVRHEAGDELFIKGHSNEKTLIYYPRPEHAIIRYGKERIHYAITVPDGEARYILDRDTGSISTEKGPQMLLPDPRRNVIVKRILSPKMVRLLYPDNQEAANYNTRLMDATGDRSATGRGSSGYVTESLARSLVAGDEDSLECADSGGQSYGYSTDYVTGAQDKSAAPRSKKSKRARAEFVGDSVQRSNSFTKPRTLTLDSKFEGAVEVKIWNGFAIMVTDIKGNRRVEIGPKTVLLEYDEEVEAMALSTGKPKTTDSLFETAYLRVLHNKVSDIIKDGETSDFCNVQLKLSYRVNFEEEGDSEEDRIESRRRWFDVENYVKFLCDHMRSKIKNMIKSTSIEQFHSDAINLIRNCVLGESIEGKRVGQEFENGMRIYDVEVLKVVIGDQDIANLLVDEQHAVVKQGLQIEGEKRRLELKKQQAEIQKEILDLDEDTDKKVTKIRKDKAKRQHEINLDQAEKASALRSMRDADIIEAEKTVDSTHASQLAREKTAAGQEDAIAKLALENLIKESEASTLSAVEKAKAFGPEIIAALNAFSSRTLAIEACKAMAPAALAHGESIVSVLENLVDGTVLNVAPGDLASITGNLRKQKLPHDDKVE